MRHVGKDIDTVDEWPRKPPLVAGDGAGGTGAGFKGVAEIAARTFVKKKTAPFAG